METAIGVLLGAVATVLASRYYFLRSVNKSLGVYGLLNSAVFSDIAADVRKQLSFRFQDKEVNELQQLVFLVANDGERAIRDVIEPLRLSLPADVEILDASILHRNPDGLDASVKLPQPPAGPGATLLFQFPLLNKGEFFVVKLLLSGHLPVAGITFDILADDLPRKISVKELPPAAVRDTGYQVEWTFVGIGAVFLLFPAWILYCLYLLVGLQPSLFPYPWSTYSPSLQSVFVLAPAAILVLLFGLFGLVAVANGAFGGDFPPPWGRRFPLPKHLQHSVFSYRILERQDVPVQPGTKT